MLPFFWFQYGFRSSQSTVVSDRATQAVALDISKAFDRVWHAGLLHKLKNHFLLESGRFDIFEIVMVSKILHFYIFCFVYGQYEFLNFFSNFDGSFPSYD